MNSKISKNYFKIFFLIVTLFSIQWASSHVYLAEQTYNERTANTQQFASNTTKFNSFSFKQINYSDNFEVDTSVELQKRKIFDVASIAIIYTPIIYSYLSQNEINISFHIYFNDSLHKVSNPRAPPFS